MRASPNNPWPTRYCLNPTVRDVEEPDRFDNDFNDSESEDEDDGSAEETALRKNERAAKVQSYLSVDYFCFLLIAMCNRTAEVRSTEMNIYVYLCI